MNALERLRASEPADRVAAINELVQQPGADPEQLRALAECLAHPEKAVVRSAAEAFATLAQQGVAVRDVLVRCLDSADARQRWGAAFALSLLAEAPPPQTLPILLNALGSNDGDVRWAAADILLHLRELELVDRLCALTAHGNAMQRKMAAYCLRDLGVRAPTVDRALCAALDDSEPGVRLAAMSGLARVGTQRATIAQRVIALLGDSDAGVRRAAAAVLGRLGEAAQPVVAALRAAAENSDVSLQRAAQRSLRLLRCAPQDGS